MEHPPYSPDMAPSDFHLFLSMQNHLNDKQFVNMLEAENFARDFFQSKDAAFYRCGIEKLVERWEKIIKLEGEYYTP